MRIAIGCDHRGAKVARRLIYDLLLRDHYVGAHNVGAHNVGEAQELDLFTKDRALGAFLISDAACDDLHEKKEREKEEQGEKEEGKKEEGEKARAKIERIFYSQDKQRNDFEQPPTDEFRPVDYPNVAAAVAEKVANGEADYGILICATGIGMCVVANKFKGIRAAICYDEVAAELSRRHNDANILCLSSDFVGLPILEAIVRKWLDSPYDGGRHQRRVELIDKIEEKTGL